MKKTHLPGIIIAVFFSFIIFFSMQWGPWAYNDSSAYLSAARNFATGNGSVIVHTTGKIKQLTEFPPFYPLFLSAFGGSDGNYISITRILNSALFGCAIYAFYALISHIVSSSRLLPIFATLLFSSFRYTIQLFTGVMSETLFIPTLIFVFYCFSQFLDGKNRILWFTLLVISSAILPITRYAGILFNGIIVLMILVFGREDLKRRIRDTLIYMLGAFTPIGILAMQLLIKYKKFAGKNFKLNLSLFKKMVNSTVYLFQAAADWFPYQAEYAESTLGLFLSILGVVSIIGLAGLPIIHFFRNHLNKHIKNSAFHLFITVSLIGYAALIIFMHSTSSPPIDIIDRTIFPIFPLLLISGSMLLDHYLMKFERKKWLQISLLFSAIIILRYNLLINRPYLMKLNSDGIGYTSKQLQQAGIIDAIHNINDQRVIISNLSGFILFHDNRYPIMIENFPHYPYGNGNSYGESEFREENAALVIMKSEFNNFYGASAKNLYQTLTNSLIIEYEDSEGIILSSPEITQQ